MKDIDKIRPLLKAFKMGYVDMEYSVQFIKKVFTDSKSFNYHNFTKGVIVGVAITLLSYAIK